MGADFPSQIVARKCLPTGAQGLQIRTNGGSFYAPCLAIATAEVAFCTMIFDANFQAINGVLSDVNLEKFLLISIIVFSAIVYSISIITFTNFPAIEIFLPSFNWRILFA
jgi:hypothetical protein